MLNKKEFISDWPPKASLFAIDLPFANNWLTIDHYKGIIKIKQKPNQIRMRASQIRCINGADPSYDQYLEVRRGLLYKERDLIEGAERCRCAGDPLPGVF
jgi:hypothetical protein